jgi:hypothetical protein
LLLKEGVSLIGYSPLHTILDGRGLASLIELAHSIEGGVGTVSNLILTGAGVGIKTNGYKVNIQNVVFTMLGTALSVEPASEINVINNTFVSNTGSAIEIINAKMELRNNIIIRNGGAGISNIGAHITGGYNDIWGNKLGSWLNPISQPGNISTDVLFVDTDAYDFRVLSGEPTIDGAYPKDSYEKEPKPNGSRRNIGAFGNTKFATKSEPKAIPGLEEGPGEEVVRKGRGGRCFIATAALGTMFEGKLDKFYGLRDDYLRTNLPGSDFVKLYYRLSPPVANKLKTSPTLKFLVKELLESMVKYQ